MNRGYARCVRAHSNSDDGFDELGCAVGAGLRGGAVYVAGVSPLMLAGSYFPHHALAGRGRWWKAMLGSFLGEGVSLAGMAIGAGAGDRTGALVGVVAGGVLGSLMPVLFLELDHADRRERRAARPGRVQLAASALPVRDGAVLQLGGRM